MARERESFFRRPGADAVFHALAVTVGAFALGVTSWSLGKTDPMWAIISFVLVYDPDVRAAMSAGFSRLALTFFGSGMALAVVFLFGLHRWVLPVGLMITALVSAFFLRSRAGWRIVLVTVALIVGSSLLHASAGPYIAVVRSLEVSLGSLLAIGFSWLAAGWSERRKRSAGE